MDPLKDRHCKPSERLNKLKAAHYATLLDMLEGWRLNDAGQLERSFNFHNFHETMAFVNAVAWIAHREEHHPDIQIGYQRCTIGYTTHAVGGLSENDFICAAKVDALLQAD